MMKKHVLLTMLLAVMSTSALAKSTLTLYTSQPNEDAQTTVSAFEKANPDIVLLWYAMPVVISLVPK